jgi:hypothetical protein
MSYVIGSLKDKVVASTASLFAHGPTALEHTLDHPGDPGLLGPDSVSWRVIGDAAAFVGGIRALVVQTAHPEVVAGVEDHSRYRDDPFGRLNRTSVYVTETTYGSMAEVEAAVPTIQPAVRSLIGLQPARGSDQVGRATVRALRWALGSSPSWHLALVRSGAPVSPGLFRQPLPAKPSGHANDGSA